MENNKRANKKVQQRKNSMAMEHSFVYEDTQQPSRLSRHQQRRGANEWDEPASSGMTTPSVQNVRNALPVSYIPKQISDFISGGRMRARVQ